MTQGRSEGFAHLKYDKTMMYTAAQNRSDYVAFCVGAARLGGGSQLLLHHHSGACAYFLKQRFIVADNVFFNSLSKLFYRPIENRFPEELLQLVPLQSSIPCSFRIPMFQISACF